MNQEDAGTVNSSEYNKFAATLWMYQADVDKSEYLWPAPIRKPIEVSSQRLERMKNMMDTNQFTVLSAAPQSGKTTFMDVLDGYLDSEGENVVSMSMKLGDWETINEEEWSDFFQCWSETSWDDILGSKSTIYLLLDDVHVMFGNAEKFWSIILRLRDTGGQHVRVLMSARSNAMNTIFPRNVSILTDENLQLSRQETRSLLRDIMQEKLSESQHQFLYEVTSGRPELLQGIITDCQKYGNKFNGTLKSLMKFMVSLDMVMLLKKHPAQDLGTYKDEEKEFITKMLMEMDSAGVFVIPEKNQQIMNTIKSLEKHGAICYAEGGVRFRAPLFRMGFADSLFLPRVGLYTQDNRYTFVEMVEHCLRGLEPEQIKKFIETGTERARRELLVALCAVACQTKQPFHVAVPFVGSTFGYSLDIHFTGDVVTGDVDWALDIMPTNDTADIPMHIRGFVNGGVIGGSIEQWAVLHISHTPVDPSNIEQNHWYLQCLPDCTSGLLMRKGFEAVHLRFRCKDVYEPSCRQENDNVRQGLPFYFYLALFLLFGFLFMKAST